MRDLIRALSRRGLAGAPASPDALAAEVRQWQRELGDLPTATLRGVVEGWEEQRWPTAAALRQRAAPGAENRAIGRTVCIPGPAATAADVARWPAVVAGLAAECQVLPPAECLGRLTGIRVFIEPLKVLVEGSVLWLEPPIGGQAGEVWAVALTGGASTAAGIYRCPVELAHLRAATGVATGLRVAAEARRAWKYDMSCRDM